MKVVGMAAVLALAASSLFCCNLSAQDKPKDVKYSTVKANQNAHPVVDWCKNAVIYEVNLRQGTRNGTFNSFINEIPRLKELGVDILWLMPIHPISELNRKGELGSYYAVADYKAVNPEFGSEADFRNLVDAAHRHGMKVILDEVCNHTGCDHPWTKSNPEYYMRDEKGQFTSPYDWTDTYELDYDNPELRREMIDVLKYWVAEFGVDGYRCDVAGEVPTDFWEAARRELQKIRPVFMLAESTKPELLAKAFDADYNWPMKDLFNAIAATQGVNEYAKAKKQNLPVAKAVHIDSLVRVQQRQYPNGAFQMNMITNHDLNSWEGTEFERYSDGVKAFAVLSYTLPGIPMMYTGQEVGFNHPFEFFVKDPKSPVYIGNEYTDFYTQLNYLKKENNALDVATPHNKYFSYKTDNENVLFFVRMSPDNRVVVVVNLSSKSAKLRFTGSIPKMNGMINYFTNKEETLPKELKPWEYRVYVNP